MSDVREIVSGPAALTWDAESRVATLRFTVPEAGRHEHAEQLTAALASWTSETSENGHRYRFLVDCSSIADVDAGWRATWAEFFKGQTRQAVVAWFNASPWIKVVITMFRKGTGIHGAVFSSEEDATEWLLNETPREVGR